MAEPIAYTTEQIMEQAQGFASAWSLVGGRFDAGDQLEVAEQEKAELAAMASSMATRIEQLEASNRLLSSTDMAKTLDIVAIGEALGIPGEEQQGGIAEFIEAIEGLRAPAPIAEDPMAWMCDDGMGYVSATTSPAVRDDWIRQEIMVFPLVRTSLPAEGERLRKDAERYRWLRDHEATCIWEEGDTEVRNHPGALDEAVDESIAKEASNA